MEELRKKKKKNLTGALPCFVILGLVEEGAGHHGQQQQRQAAGDPLHAGEGAAVRPLEAGEPQVRVRDADPRVLLEELLEGLHLLVQGHGHCPVRQPVLLVPRKPPLADEVVAV